LSNEKYVLKNKLKGWFGEKKSAFKLWYSLNNKVYHRYNNLILPAKNGTTQIDHLVISPYGLFIVETKNKKGWIFGSGDQSNWTQVIFQKKYAFQNPLRQTFRQKKVLIELLEINESEIFTVVYFNGHCTFKTPMPYNVLNSGLANYIKSFNEIILSQKEVDRINNLLSQIISESKLTAKDHIKSLQNRHSSNTVCPNCGSDLAVRTSKYKHPSEAQFLGCNAFPKCRFTKNL